MNEVKNIIKLNKICVQFGVISIVFVNIWYSSKRLKDLQFR